MATVGLFWACCLMCACVHTLAENYINCSTNNPNVKPRKSKRLSVSIIANVTAETIELCASTCLKRSACRSFNYKLNASRYQCQLNEFDHEDETQDDPNYMYSPISDWNPLLANSCANHNCSEDSFCYPSSNQKYRCLQLDIQCRSPRRVENAEIQWPYSRRYKSEIKYTCKRGYKYSSGNSTSVCQLNWAWSESSLNCSKVICGIPPNKTNTELKNHTGIDYSSTAYYNCRAGYNSTRYVGEARCTANGTWTEPNINCTEINCGPPDNYTTATVTTFNGTSIDDIAVYSCIANTILKSSKNISVCSSNGSWLYPVECGYCKHNTNITYQGKHFCYKRSDLMTSYYKLIQQKYHLIASEAPVMGFFQKEARKYKTDIFAGFKVNATHVSFANGTIFNITASFDLQDCKYGICVYNASGELTELKNKTEAIAYSISDPLLKRN